MKRNLFFYLYICACLGFAYYLSSTKLNPQKSKKIFYAEDKISKYFPSPFRFLVMFLGILLLLKVFDNQVVFFSLSFLWFVFSILFDLYFLSSKMLIIENNQIYSPLHWKFDIGNLKEWHLDKEKKAISFTDKHNKKYHFFSIKDSDMEKLQIILCNEL